MPASDGTWSKPSSRLERAQTVLQGQAHLFFADLWPWPQLLSVRSNLNDWLAFRFICLGQSPTAASIVLATINRKEQPAMARPLNFATAHVTGGLMMMTAKAASETA